MPRSFTRPLPQPSVRVRRLVCDRAAGALEAGSALLAAALDLAGGIEATNGCLGPGSDGLVRLGVEGLDEGGRVGQPAAGGLQSVGADAPPVPPQARAGGAEERDDADGLANG